MFENWQEKLVKWLLTAGITVLTGGGVLQITTGTGIGKIMLNSFASAISISFLNPGKIADELYSSWAGKPIFGALQFHLEGILLLPLLFLLLAHVVAKKSAEAAPSGQPRVRRLRRLQQVYHRHYGFVTWALLAILLVAMFFAPSPFWLLAIFLALALPVAVYLFLYRQDCIAGGFWDRLIYLSLAVVFVFSLYMLPKVYGERFFDLSLRPVVSMNGQSEAGVDRATFVFDDAGKFFCRIYFEKDRLQIELLDPPESYQSAPTLAGLREMAKTLEPPHARDAESLLGDFKQDLAIALGAP